MNMRPGELAHIVLRLLIKMKKFIIFLLLCLTIFLISYNEFNRTFNIFAGVQYYYIHGMHRNNNVIIPNISEDQFMQILQTHDMRRVINTNHRPRVAQHNTPIPNDFVLINFAFGENFKVYGLVIDFETPKVTVHGFSNFFFIDWQLLEPERFIYEIYQFTPIQYYPFR